MNRKILFVVLFLASLCTISYAQVDPDLDPDPVAEDTINYWKTEAKFSFNVQQVGLTNWAAGGESSLALGAVLQANGKYEKDQVVWENNARIAYGVLRQGAVDNRFEKTDDIINLSSKYSQKFSEKVLMTSAILFQTQMDEGYKYEDIPNSSDKRRVLISNFLAPGYMQASLGLTYREGDIMDMTLSPFTGRFTFVMNDSLANAGAFGVLPGETFRAEAGISFNGNVKAKLMKNVDFKMGINLFSNYEKFPNTVVNGLAEIVLKVNDYIASTITSQIIYDDDVMINFDDGTQGRALQIKNVINVGLTIGFK
ncbi:Protein of unknown function (DUF3078) [Roseivirga pacifica]|uniref:DUF3078 domain-containing protein n=1 Tax=Roseivirga pacifica TaxID=1267423 RepID=A0A1I0NTH2_9BACT|nr:DUF3078 domain-containing protein [Roseivirga pacifica]MCO6359959.1 DUF3078 domain-containing protein [Roseivirga pacifica]MCO6367329.1 DUF3078 domain-containing protein [Roseivirga pacifica]MCO6370139.1 DUF3078 domain-containing protein [Roseivirga pacifica]MCO6374986.1 DUF3078 domain-containing protein [Roseivirga pacifica]MCO6380244.1 DUF3078 domain-containing protein [Roseivirga pacifica]